MRLPTQPKKRKQEADERRAQGYLAQNKWAQGYQAQNKRAQGYQAQNKRAQALEAQDEGTKHKQDKKAKRSIGGK